MLDTQLDPILECKTETHTKSVSFFDVVAYIETLYIETPYIDALNTETLYETRYKKMSRVARHFWNIFSCMCHIILCSTTF